MIGSWGDLLDFVWWSLTGRESRPHFRMTIRPSRSALAAVMWSWLSALLLLSAFIAVVDVNNPVPTWVFAVIGAIALLWAPTRYAFFASARKLRNMAVIALGIGAPVLFLPVPPDVEMLAVHRLALWLLIGVGTALAAPLLALPLRVLRSCSAPRREM
jgi:hypothetical protein